MSNVWFMCFCEVGGCAGAGAAGEELRLCIGIGTVKAGGCGGAMEDFAAAGGIAYGTRIGSRLHHDLHHPLLYSPYYPLTPKYTPP